MPYTFDDQVHLVWTGTTGLKEEDVHKIARKCIEARDRGENSSVWHQTALHFGTVCHCQPCELARK